jgi:energy-coupling factor transporter ATP-binding protein EcfA2
VRLHRVEVGNFRRHEHFAIDLRDPDGKPHPLTLLVGPNMSGKTTLLDAVHLAYEAVRNPKSPVFRPGFDPADPTQRPDPNKPIEVALWFSLHDDEWEAMNELERKLGGDLRVEKAPLYHFRLRYHGSAQIEIADASPSDAQLALRGRALAAVAMQRRVAQEEVLDRVGGMLYLDQHRSGTLRSADGRLDFARDALPGLPSPDVVGWLGRASTTHLRWDEAARGKSQWTRVKALFRDLAYPAELDDAVPFDDGYDLRFRREDRTYFMAGTSSGEEQLLRLAANLAFFRAERSIVMVDELELNLHPRWQRKLLGFCEKGMGGDNQIIGTTHSDEMLSFAEPGSVVTLGVPKGGWA